MIIWNDEIHLECVLRHSVFGWCGGRCRCVCVYKIEINMNINPETYFIVSVARERDSDIGSDAIFITIFKLEFAFSWKQISGIWIEFKWRLVLVCGAKKKELLSCSCCWLNEWRMHRNWAVIWNNISDDFVHLRFMHFIRRFVWRTPVLTILIDERRALLARDR